MLHCQVPPCAAPAVEPANAPLLCAAHRNVYRGRVKFLPLLQWILLWSMASANEARWKRDIFEGRPPDYVQDRLTLTAGKWLDIVKDGVKLWLDEVGIVKGTASEIKWMRFQFLEKTSRTIQRHTIATYLQMLCMVPAGHKPLVRVIQKKPQLLAYGNVSTEFLGQFIMRLSAQRVGKDDITVLDGPWRLPKMKELPPGQS